MNAPHLVTQTHGMGVDSAAWLAGVLLGELPRPFDLAHLTVVTAMVGDESDATRDAMTAHMLPLMEAHGVRYVQVARRSMSDADGIVVLSDTAAGDPYRMVMRGAVALSDEMLTAGTIPQVSSRTCSHKWKGWVLDRWAGQEYAGAHMLDLVHAEQTTRGGSLETVAGAPRLVFRRAEAPYPAVEHYLAVGVAGAAKERPAFDELWSFVTGLDLPRQGDLLAGAR